MAYHRMSKRLKLQNSYTKTFMKLFAKQFYAVHRGKPFDFNAVTRVMKEISKYDFDLSVFWQYMKIAFELIDFFDCRDVRVIIKAISFKYNPYCGKDYKHGWRVAIFNTKKLMEIPYDHAYEDRPFYNPVFIEVLNGHCQSVERLLRYGMICRPPYDKMSEWLTALHIIDKYTGLKVKRTAYFYRWEQNLYGRRRTLMVLRGIRVLIQNSFPWQNAYLSSVRCFKMVFETIPECYITREEVERCLRKFVVPNDYHENLIKSIGEEFEKHFPTSKGPLRPRSLLHLSRCQVRQCMREAHTLWYGAKDLDIPVALQEYINPKF